MQVLDSFGKLVILGLLLDREVVECPKSQALCPECIVSVRCAYHFFTAAESVADACGNAAWHRFGCSERNHGETTPKQVAGSCVAIRHRVVEGQVCQIASIYVILFCHLWCHYYSLRIDPISDSLSLQILESVDRVLKYPEHRVWHCLQYVHPYLERHRVQLVHLIEVCKDELVLRQVVLLARRTEAPGLERLPARLGVIVEEVRVGHVNRFFGVELLHDFRR